MTDKDNEPTYSESYKQLSKSFLATNISLNASMLIQRKKMHDQYNSFAKVQAKRYLKEFQKGKNRPLSKQTLFTRRSVRACWSMTLCSSRRPTSGCSSATSLLKAPLCPRTTR